MRFSFEGDCGKTLQRLAREQAKANILRDIMIDLTVCKVEGWDCHEYINELREMLNEIQKNFEKSENLRDRAGRLGDSERCAHGSCGV